jgi:multidrug efflux system membrane fusion protein
MNTFGRVLLWGPRTLLYSIARLGHGVRRVLGSFRFWVLFILSVLVVLVIYYALADRFTPLTTDAYVQTFVIQVAPQVDGQVVRVPVGEGDAVKAGSLLFEIDPRPFEHKVAYLEAKLVEAEQHVKQLGAELAAARADHERRVAEAAYADSVHRQEQQIFKTDSTTERRYLDALQKNKASQAAVQQAAEEVRRVDLALQARIAGEHTLVAQVKAQLAEARLNLTFTRVYAPCDGMITDLQLRTGSYLHTGQSAMTLIDSGHWMVVANFRENALSRLRPGQPALVAFRAVPGQMFRATVFRIGGGVGQGQGVPSGLLPDVKRQASWVQPAQRFQVRLTLDVPESVLLRVGMTGSVAIYTEDEGLFNDITRAWHTAITWLYYL